MSTTLPVPTDTVLELQTQSVGGFALHVVTFNANFISPFTLSYDIAIDLIKSPTKNIVRVSGDLSNPSNIGAPATAKAVFSEAGVLLGTVTSVSGNPGPPLAVKQTALHVQDVYVPGGGAAVSVANSFAQDSGVPEPLTVVLIGSGLLLLSRVKRQSS